MRWRSTMPPVAGPSEPGALRGSADGCGRAERSRAFGIAWQARDPDARAAADAALPSLLGHGGGLLPGWDGHDARRKCGIITDAQIVSSRGATGEVRAAGYLFGRDFPEVERHLRADASRANGHGYELADAHVEDMRASVWRLTKVTFTGAAILAAREGCLSRHVLSSCAQAENRSRSRGRLWQACGA